MMRRGATVTWHELDGQLVGFDARSGRYLRVNGPGAVVWERLADGAEFDDLVAAVADAYGVSPDVVRGDVSAFVAELRAQGLLQE